MRTEKERQGTAARTKGRRGATSEDEEAEDEEERAERREAKGDNDNDKISAEKSTTVGFIGWGRGDSEKGPKMAKMLGLIAGGPP